MNRYQCLLASGRTPFAIRSITTIPLNVENCAQAPSVCQHSAQTPGEPPFERQLTTHPVPDEHLRPLRDEHVQRLRDVLLLGGQHEVPAARDVRPGVSRP